MYCLIATQDMDGNQYFSRKYKTLNLKNAQMIPTAQYMLVSINGKNSNRARVSALDLCMYREVRIG